MQSRYIETSDGLTLHVVDYGGDGPPLLAVHGTGLVAQVWGVMVSHLAPGFHVYALDRKGHGESEKPARGYELEAAVAEYAAVVEAIGGDDWVAVGHSSGGTSLGLTSVRRPGLFRRIVMVDPVVFPRRPPLEEAVDSIVERTRHRREHWPSTRAMFDDLRQKSAYRRWQPEALWAYVNHGAEIGEDGSVRLKCPPALEASMYGAASQVDLFDAFARIPVPALLLRGEQSNRLARESAERVAASNPLISFVEVAGLTHFPSMEDPRLVARLCAEFFTTAPSDD